MTPDREMRSSLDTPELVFEDGGVGIVLPGAPFAAEGATLADAAADMVDALREYAEDWPRLRQSPNHMHLAALVTFVDISTDEQLMSWLTGAG